MPVRDTLQRSDGLGETELRTELKAEFDNPKESGEPDIVVERPNPSTAHVFVIWSKWKHLEQMIRSRIIIEAYTEARGADEAAKITVAMGLTRSEATRMGIK